MAEFCAALGFDERSVVSAAEALRRDGSKGKPIEMQSQAKPLVHSDSFSTIRLHSGLQLHSYSHMFNNYVLARSHKHHQASPFSPIMSLQLRQASYLWVCIFLLLDPFGHSHVTVIRRPVLNVPDVFQPCLSLAGPSHSWTVLCKCFWTEFAFLSLRQRRVVSMIFHEGQGNSHNK